MTSPYDDPLGKRVLQHARDLAAGRDVPQSELNKSWSLACSSLTETVVKLNAIHQAVLLAGYDDVPAWFERMECGRT